MTTTAPVTRTDHEGVATVLLHRPERKNAITGPLLEALAAHITAISADPTIGAVVLGGSGGAFCSGLDLDEYTADPPPPWLADAATHLRAAHVALASCPQPIVVALERYAINGGAAFALAADYLVVGEQAWLQVGEARIGMNAPMNLAWLLLRHPVPTVQRVVLRGDRIPGPELVRLHLAHEAVADDAVLARAEEVAREMAACPNGAAQQMKLAVRRVDGREDVEAWFERAATLGSFAGKGPSRMA